MAMHGANPSDRSSDGLGCDYKRTVALADHLQRGSAPSTVLIVLSASFVFGNSIERDDFEDQDGFGLPFGSHSVDF